MTLATSRLFYYHTRTRRCACVHSRVTCVHIKMRARGYVSNRKQLNLSVYCCVCVANKEEEGSRRIDNNARIRDWLQ